MSGPRGWFSRLKAGLSRSSSNLTERIAEVVVSRRKLDAATLEELEEALIMADLGVDTAAALVKEVGKDRFGREVTDVEIREALAAAVAHMLEPVAEPLPHRARFRPQVVLVCGVNGTGKTTTIGKLAAQHVAAGRKVMLAAGDTFRAAAVEQLAVWGQRVGAEVVHGKEGGDPSSVVFEALKRAQAENVDVLIVDTAGRLHVKQELMEELAKVRRVMKKAEPSAPHETWLVLDATNGQNAIAQATTFKDLVEVSGIVLTKLDGTAKGGVILGICHELQVPVRYIGIGEQVDDLRVFEPRDFIDALYELPGPDKASAEASA